MEESLKEEVLNLSKQLREANLLLARASGDRAAAEKERDELKNKFEYLEKEPVAKNDGDTNRQLSSATTRIGALTVENANLKVCHMVSSGPIPVKHHCLLVRSCTTGARGRA